MKKEQLRKQLANDPGDRVAIAAQVLDVGKSDRTIRIGTFEKCDHPADRPLPVRLDQLLGDRWEFGNRPREIRERLEQFDISDVGDRWVNGPLTCKALGYLGRRGPGIEQLTQHADAAAGR